MTVFTVRVSRSQAVTQQEKKCPMQKIHNAFVAQPSRFISLATAALALAVAVLVSNAFGAPYNLANAAGTTVKYEIKQVTANVTAANSIVRSLGLSGQSGQPDDPDFGVLTDATVSPDAGPGQSGSDAFVSRRSLGGDDNDANGMLDYLTQGGSVNVGRIDLTFVAASGQKFTAGDFRVNTTVLNAGLWDAGVDYLAWQVSTDGGGSFADIMRRYMPAGSSREDSGVLAIPGIADATTIIIRGVIDASAGSNNYSTCSHWQLLDTPPYYTGTFNGGLEMNLTTARIPEPATLTLGGAAMLALLFRRRRN